MSHCLEDCVPIFEGLVSVTDKILSVEVFVLTMGN